MRKISVNDSFHRFLLAVASIVAAFSASAASADVWFLGIGNGGYWSSATGLWSAYWATPNPLHTSRYFRLRGEVAGSEMSTEIRWLSLYARPSDVVIFYYVGHGNQGTDYNGDELAGSALTSYDETIGVYGDQCTDDQIAQALGRIDDRAAVIAIFDMCYAGGMVEGLADLDSLPNVLVMMSSREDQLSYAGTRYGDFTSKLVEGLGPSWPADLNHNGAITFNEWFTYARQELAIRDLQTPVLFDAANIGSLHLTSVPGWPLPEPTTIHLTLLAIAAFGLRRRQTSSARR